MKQKLCVECGRTHSRRHSRRCQICHNEYVRKWYERRRKLGPERILVRCYRCHNEFEIHPALVTVPNLLFCSSTCRTSRCVIKCDRCGNSVSRKSSLAILKTKVGRFCSTSCRARMAAKRGSDNPRYRRIKQSCVICGNTKDRRVYSLSRDYLCSPACHARYLSLRATGALNVFWKGGQTKVSCSQCGEPLFRDPSELTYRKDHFCNRACLAKWKSINVRGAIHPNWKGGISKEPYPFEWSARLRETIRERDGRVCVLCGIAEIDCKIKLHVHHIDYDKRNLAPINLVSLCGVCHPKTNFNRSYWMDWFADNLRERLGAKYKISSQKGD